MRKRLAAALAAGCMAFGLCQAAKPLTVSADTADVVFVLDFSASMTWGVDSMSDSHDDRIGFQNPVHGKRPEQRHRHACQSESG